LLIYITDSTIYLLIYFNSSVASTSSIIYIIFLCSLEFKEDKLLIEHTQDSRIKWTWCLVFIFLVPECIGILNSLWHYFFKRRPRMPKKLNILFMMLIETFHTIGLVLLIFVILPEINAVQGAAIFCCLCFIPGLLSKFLHNLINKITNKNCQIFYINFQKKYFFSIFF